MWPGFALRKASQRFAAMAEEMLGPSGLTLRHFGVLCSVHAEPGQNQRVIGERLRIDRSSVVTILDDLERAGLLQRRRADRRTFALHLTDAGAERLSELEAIMARLHAEFLAPLSPAEQTVLRELLIRLAEGRA